VSKRLKEEGIASAIYYPVPLHLQEVHAHLRHEPGSLPNSEQVAQRCLSLPIFPELSEEQVSRVVETLRAAVASTCSAGNPAS